MCVCVCVCVRERERERDRQTDRDRQKDREREEGKKEGRRKEGKKEGREDGRKEGRKVGKGLCLRKQIFDLAKATQSFSLIPVQLIFWIGTIIEHLLLPESVPGTKKYFYFSGRKNHNSLLVIVQ